MVDALKVTPKIKPKLDPGFVPGVLWNRAFSREVEKAGSAVDFGIALAKDEAVTVRRGKLLPPGPEGRQLNRRYVERLLKFMLWQKGGHRVLLAADEDLVDYIRQVYSPDGERAFDYDFMGRKIYDRPFEVEQVALDQLPEEREKKQVLGGHLEGYRIGFDLGGSDRKAAAVVNGEVIHSEEIVWDPYFQKNPDWHYREILDSLKRAADKMPRVDAIGGSAAGVYVDNQIRVASLFRGVSDEEFEEKVRPLFLRMREEWGGIPFEVVNDGEVTALAGAMSLDDGAVLGVAMGTSLAAGYVTPDGHLTSGLDELAFVPVDYREDAPVDEWSGDPGVGAQYFSQQAVARLAPLAGFDFPEEMPLPERLVEVQKAMSSGDGRARDVYETIGTYFGYNVAHYDDFYTLRHILVLGRVMSGEGGQVILDTAGEVLRSEFSELADQIELITPGEKEKRHGQAVAAASLPELDGNR